MKTVTIIMYHYVRDLKISRYPRIKGLTIEEFISQLNFIEKHFEVVRMEDCLACIGDVNKKLPGNAALLTFDDGYLEHYSEVFPILDSRGIQGSFFPPVQSTMEGKVLDVNKIHFILASHKEPEFLLDRLRIEIVNLQKDFNLNDPEFYFNRIDNSEHPYDPIEIVRFKRVLQRELPLAARKQIISVLFDEIVKVREEVFSKELYMNESQLKTLMRHGMFVGGHGYSHKWLSTLEKTDQNDELEKTEGFLEYLGVENEEKVMCYPYGGYNDSLITQLRESRFVAGLGTTPGKAVLDQEHRFTLNRIDTNEIGKDQL